MDSLNPNIEHYRVFIQQTKRFLVYLPNYFLFLSWRCRGGNDEHALNLASGWEINIFDDFIVAAVAITNSPLNSRILDKLSRIIM